MITRDALYEFVEATINAASDGDALFDAKSFRNVRGSVDEHDKVIRVECFDGVHTMATEDCIKELRVRATIQCWVLPETDTLEDLDDAIDVSFDMSRDLFRAIPSDSDLGGKVEGVDAQEFETGFANLGALRRGVTYLDVIVNQ